MSKRTWGITLPICTAIVAASAWWTQAGSLTPPGGPVTSTMKPLTEIEPRVNLNTLPGSATAVIDVTAPGSYYLTANVIGVSGKNGIEINSPGVTIDLNGFSVIGGPGTLDGITCNTVGGAMLNVRNGEVRDWTNAGIRVDWPAYGGLLSDLRLIDNGDGILGLRTVVSNCVAIACGRGVSVNEGSIINCTATDCGDGFDGFFGTIIEGCTGKYNSYGIVLGAGATARNNNVQFGWTTGIYLYDYSRAVDNLVDEIQGDGIGVDNTWGTGLGNVIENNTVTRCTGAGILMWNGAYSNFIARNRVHDSGVLNYDLGAGNAYGPIVNVAGLGNLATSGAPNQDHPMANYEY